jgi:flagellar protein FlgJ
MAVTVIPALLAATPAKASLSPAEIEKVRKAAQDFEAMALGELLQPMFKTVDTSKGLFGGGAGEATWKPMMVDEIAKTIARHGGIGLADSVMREMLRMQETKHD